ncbi:MAG: penicillin acylase family protein [Pseudomonadota bacterium]|nr:penicillin acylase family protein [Pseudomonadota bacterium]
MDRPSHHLRTLVIAASLAALPAPLAASGPTDLARWRAEAARVTITRDDRGIPHVRGRSDADAVFGAIYAQAEDDFPRIEANYLTALGRTAEAEGESAIWKDLRQRLYVDPAELQAQYRASPAWLRRLMDAWADGLNFYLATHPEVRPRVLTRFEPWMALSFTEGSIGGDIERISLSELATFYGATPIARTAEELGSRPAEPRGSNGIAIAPRLTRNGHALLLINPHTSFYFRSEMQMTSDEGLNAYGASTWGQFFIYQGFNSRIGWMHTSSGVDSVDEFALAVVPRRGQQHYRYGKALRPLARRPVTIVVRQPDGRMTTRLFVTWRSHHGPIVAARDGKWIAQSLMWRPIPAPEQSWLRTKAKDLASYLAISARRANSSNATIIADAKGQIAYLHPQFVPVRDDRFDYTRPVDGSNPATDWRGLHSLPSLPQSISPPTGWTMNTNNWPWTAAGAFSPRASDFPRYMDSAGENARGVHALLLLKGARQMTPQTLMALAYDSYLPAFATLVPQLVAAFDALPETDPQRAHLKGPIALLRHWDKRWSLTSEATSLAVFWGDGLGGQVGASAKALRINLPDYIATRVSPADKLAALKTAVAKLERDFGSWRVPWGRINRFQRLDNQIAPHFDDGKGSIAIPFTSAQWGSLASYGARSYPNTKRYYGTSGNSFVAIVEFGPKLRAWAVMAGGQSGDPGSKHFADQAERYASGQLRPVYFYPTDLRGHVSRRYSPGQ